MAFTAQQLRELLAEVGEGTSVGTDDEDTMWLIYDSEGDASILKTAWWVWKKRLADLNEKSFDVTTGGSLMSRKQRVAFIEDRIASLEWSMGAAVLDRTRALQDDVQSTLQINADLAGTELS